MKRKYLLLSTFLIIVTLFILFLLNNLKLQQKPTADENSPTSTSHRLYCENDSDCFWYQSGGGDYLGDISCAGANYQNTCANCEKLSADEAEKLQLPKDMTCLCNSLNTCVGKR